MVSRNTGGLGDMVLHHPINAASRLEAGNRRPAFNAKEVFSNNL